MKQYCFIIINEKENYSTEIVCFGKTFIKRCYPLALEIRNNLRTTATMIIWIEKQILPGKIKSPGEGFDHRAALQVYSIKHSARCDERYKRRKIQTPVLKKACSIVEITSTKYLRDNLMTYFFITEYDSSFINFILNNPSSPHHV